jgi:hypothetical protein
MFSTATHFDVKGLSLIVNVLLKIGFSKEDINEIMGEYIIDFMLKNLTAR